jgi:D-serine deaminase-like pyridoxal phosphate-dependent protein
MDEVNWFKIQNTDKIDSPNLIIYPDRVKHNIDLLKSMIDNPSRLRPHIKTHKSPSATVMLLEAGIWKFKCATIAEAEMLGMCSAPDVLLAYQPNGPKLERFIKLIQKYPLTKYSCLIDNKKTADMIAASAVENHLVIPVYIDLNVGMDRTGIAPGTLAVQLYQYCTTLPGIQIMGFHAYDGHNHDKEIAKRKLVCEKIMADIELMISELSENEIAKPIIIAGGSPSFPIYAQYPEIECSPGTFILWDKGYIDNLPEQGFLPAALVITRVISILSDNKICVDLGHKSIASENELHSRIYFINTPNAKPVSQSEEHLVLEVPGKQRWEIGDILYGLPQHICPTCALYEMGHTVEHNLVTGLWPITARDRKISI